MTAIYRGVVIKYNVEDTPRGYLHANNFVLTSGRDGMCCDYSETEVESDEFYAMLADDTKKMIDEDLRVNGRV